MAVMKNRLPFLTGIRKNLLLIIIILVTLAFLFPFYWMVVGSITTHARLMEPSTLETLIPTTFNSMNYEKLFDNNPVSKWFINSVLFAGTTTVVVVLTNTMAGYALAKKRFFGNKALFMVFVGTIMLPRQILIVPMYLTMVDLKLIGNPFSVILPAMAWPLGIFLMRQFMHTIPNEILESSSIDGASEIRIFFTMVLPLSKPGIGALTILTFMAVWNDFLWQLVIISEKAQTTLPLGIASLQNELIADYGVLFAGATIAAVPMITVFIVFQRYFTRGLTLGSVKG